MHPVGSPGSQCKQWKTAGHCDKGANESKLQYMLVFPKHTKEMVAKPIMEKTSRDYLNPVVDIIVGRKRQNPAAEDNTKLTTRFSNN